MLYNMIDIEHSLLRIGVDVSNAFEIVEVGKKKVVLVAESAQDKAVWIEKIEVIIAKFFEKYFQTKVSVSQSIGMSFHLLLLLVLVVVVLVVLVVVVLVVVLGY
jgi:hypothetical protein